MKFCYAFLCIIFSFKIVAQTVGVINNSPSSLDGYTIFSPVGDTNVYLIDNCGYVVNKWTTPYQPGLSVYLLKDGSILRPAQIGNSTFSQGGVGGLIQRYDWNGNLTWNFNFSTNTYCQHHDIEPLPNGNVLILATELKTYPQCIAAGRNPATLTANKLWPEFIVEVQPIGVDSGLIVWEWHAWDHLVQDFNSARNNYQPSANVPELFNLNYNPNSGGADWMHVNSIDYNPDLDQIVLSSKNWSELWVIDHSTTTTEAASHTGGNSGKGGDILYRWGNPITYGGAGTSFLDNQHDVHWIENGKPNAGKIMIFNNGRDRGWSSVDIIEPPVDAFGNYSFVGNNFGPNGLYWTYQDPIPSNFFSARISGAQQLQNGNVLVCDGLSGYFFELDSNNNKVWEYINPVTNFGIATQGQTPVNFNDVFRAYRYSANDSAFIGKNLTPTFPIELNPNTTHCTIYAGLEKTAIENNQNLSVFPNPTNSTLEVIVDKRSLGKQMKVLNCIGQCFIDTIIYNENTVLNVSKLVKGNYIIWIEGFRAQSFVVY